jgi:hypothetical protein
MPSWQSAFFARVTRIARLCQAGQARAFSLAYRLAPHPAFFQFGCSASK